MGARAGELAALAMAALRDRERVSVHVCRAVGRQRQADASFQQSAAGVSR